MELNKPVTMIWFDKDPKKTLAKMLSEGVTHYRAKYGQEPKSCLVNKFTYTLFAKEVGMPEDAPEIVLDGITIRGKRDVLLHDFYISSIGVEP